MPRASRRIAITVLLLFGCNPSGSSDDVAAVEVVDSSGVTVVTNHAPANPEGSWRLGDLVTSIGAVDGDSNQILGFPVSARRLVDGTIAVSDQFSNQIRVYDTNGDHVRNVGRQGEGPGEFQMLGFLKPYRADSLMAIELLGRISILGPDLSFARFVIPRHTFSMARDGFRPEQSCCNMVGALGGSFVLEYPGIISTTGFGARRSSVSIVRLTPEGTFEDTLGTFDSAEYHPDVAGARTPVTRAQLSNAVVSLATDSNLYVTDGLAFEVRAFDARGGLRRIIRIAREPHPADEAVIARHRESLAAEYDESLGQSGDEEYLRYLKRMLEEAPYHSTVPTINILLMDRIGNLWTGATHRWTGSESEPWDVFDPTGRWLATVDIPSVDRVMEIGEDYITLRVRDELDVPFIHVYELFKLER